MNELDLHWLAGLLEGEGCFGARAAGARLSIRLSMMDFDVMQRAANLMGTHILDAKTPKGKRTYTTELNGAQAKRLMLKLLPLMGKRRTSKIREAFALYERYISRPYKWSRLKDGDIYAIRRLHKLGISNNLLACMWCKSEPTIQRLTKKVTYA